MEIVACCVCHIDLHVFKDEVNFPCPAVLGHEISGIVIEVGEGVEHVGAGNRVVAAFIMTCGTCRHWAAGREEFFTQNRLDGKLLDGATQLRRAHGTDVATYCLAGHASQTIIPALTVFWLPDEIPLQDAATLECSMFTTYGSVVHVGQVA